MRKAIALILCLLIVLSSTNSVQAANRAVVASPSLTFSGGQASCQVQVTAPGQTIRVLMQLWYGNQLLNSWMKSGTSVVSLSGTKGGIISGNSYTLKVILTVNDQNVPCNSVTKTCP